MTQDNSPNSLQLEPEQATGVTKMSRWPLYAGIAAAFILFAVLVYSINFAHDPEADDGMKRVVIRDDERPVLMGEGSGLALEPPDETIIPAPVEPKAVEPIVVVRDEKPKVDQEAENLRRQRTQAFLNALKAPLAVKKSSSQQQQEQKAEATRNGNGITLPETPTLPNEQYNPAADIDKEDFLDSRSKADAQWILENERTAGNPLEIKTGAVIPGVMVTGINSDLPGQIIAQVSQNIFDSNTGRYLLIPQGSKLFGVYDSRIVYGQERVLVAWNRIVYPDGSSISIGTMAGTDMSGYGGYEDEVDNHYFRIFGSAILMSLIMGGTAYSLDSVTDGGDTNEYSLQSQMTASLAQQFGQTTTTLLEKNLNIKPTLEIRPGYQFNIVVSKDIVFRAPYTPAQ